ncbi:hypothetical protein Sfum_0233 [Syntrophobacter fumaroxidans MPOB]|uniref:Uncharacterized protein n=1 Tax=Syntrophobacter fumaroxidans (strain DSM 10017 / MPOB) TaxID=335543 RepID=A0LET2_SYNFM|nr:hypothetical protein Sfum_0233 [Syntrophobacter fumaroxidans MPOB]
MPMMSRAVPHHRTDRASPSYRMGSLSQPILPAGGSGVNFHRTNDVCAARPGGSTATLPGKGAPVIPVQCMSREVPSLRRIGSVPRRVFWLAKDS